MTDIASTAEDLNPNAGRRVAPPRYLGAGHIVSRALVLAVAGLGAACSPPAPAEPELFPLNAGWTWSYRVTTRSALGTSTETLEVRNEPRRELPNGPEAVERRNSWGNSYYIATDNAGIYRVAVRNEIEDLPRFDDDGPTRFVLRNPVREGMFWQVRSVPYVLRRTYDWPYELKYSQELLMGFEVVSLNEKVSVPAGDFERCVKVRGAQVLKLYTDARTGYQDVPIEQLEWYCPGAGLVRLERSETINGALIQGGAMTFELLEIERNG